MWSKLFFRALTVFLIIFIVLNLLNDYFLGDAIKADHQIVQEFTPTIQLVDGHDMEKLLKPENGKPVVLYIYASWCPSCRKMMPNILDLRQKTEFKDFNFVFFSVDEDVMKLSYYLVAQDYYRLFKPYKFRADTATPVGPVIQQTGANFAGSIPYVALLDAKGKMVAESTGAQGMQGVRSAMAELVH